MTILQPPTILWHRAEDGLQPGHQVQPGRWGKIVMSYGNNHPSFFKEQFLELWRLNHTEVEVSRLNCSYAFEDRLRAVNFRSNQREVVYQVKPPSGVPCVRLDMLWFDWLGEPHGRQGTVNDYCKYYWGGTPTSKIKAQAHPTWEWLFAGPLEIVSKTD